MAEAAAALRADLALLDASTREAASLLDLAAWQLGELGRQVAPMTSRTRQLAAAKENISAAKLRSEEVLEHLDASRKMQAAVQAGPRADLDAFLAALQRLDAAIDFLQAHRSMAAAEGALGHTAALRDAGLAAAAREFRALLAKHGSVPRAALAEAAAPGAPADPAAPGAPLGLLPEAALAKLRALAAALLRGGQAGRGAAAAYVEARQAMLRGALEGLLAPLAAGREELARLSWGQLEARIPGWVSALRLYARLAQEEARLSAAVFPPAEQAGVVAQVASAGAAQLLDAAEAVVAARRAPAKLFGCLAMHEGLEGALPALRAALAAGAARLDRASAAPGAEGAPAVARLEQLRGRLGAEARACFAAVQEGVVGEAARGAARWHGSPAGRVHCVAAAPCAGPRARSAGAVWRAGRRRAAAGGRAGGGGGAAGARGGGGDGHAGRAAGGAGRAGGRRVQQSRAGRAAPNEQHRPRGARLHRVARAQGSGRGLGGGAPAAHRRGAGSVRRGGVGPAAGSAARRRAPACAGGAGRRQGGAAGRQGAVGGREPRAGRGAGAAGLGRARRGAALCAAGRAGGAGAAALRGVLGQVAARALHRQPRQARALQPRRRGRPDQRPV